VNDKGIELSYIDSGVPAFRTSYCTVICIHGYGWSRDVFQKALPEANRQGVRLIALNRRMFPGSTPYSEEDLATIKPSEAGKPELISFLRERALEIVGFIQVIIKGLQLPCQLSLGTGISVLGWSLANMYCFALINVFMDPDLPTETRRVIKESISSVIFFGKYSNLS